MCPHKTTNPSVPSAIGHPGAARLSMRIMLTNGVGSPTREPRFDHDEHHLEGLTIPRDFLM